MTLGRFCPAGHEVLAEHAFCTECGQRAVTEAADPSREEQATASSAGETATTAGPSAWDGSLYRLAGQARRRWTQTAVPARMVLVILPLLLILGFAVTRASDDTAATTEAASPVATTPQQACVQEGVRMSALMLADPESGAEQIISAHGTKDGYLAVAYGSSGVFVRARSDLGDEGALRAVGRYLERACSSGSPVRGDGQEELRDWEAGRVNAPAAPPQPSQPPSARASAPAAQALLLQPDGLGAVSFGAPKAQAVAALRAATGAEGAEQQCVSESELAVINFSGLHALFDEDEFVGYVQSGSGLATDRGVSVGDSVLAVEDAYEATVQPVGVEEGGIYIDGPNGLPQYLVFDYPSAAGKLQYIGAGAGAGCLGD